MSGHGRPPLCKPEHVSRARELCARGAINPDLLEPASWARQQNDRRKGREGRKPRILGKHGPFQGWREAAETGGNPLQRRWNWRFTCGNCGNSYAIVLPWRGRGDHEVPARPQGELASP